LCLPDQSKLFIIPVRIIIDTDPGIDDALALILARQSPEVELRAVTVVGGNVSLDQCVRNACGLAGGVRVAKGLMPPRAEAARHIHGEDGLGGAADLLPEGKVIDSMSAPDVILELAPGSTLVTIGPMTNAAAALAADPTRFRLLHRIVSMGGAWQVPGNVVPEAEYNVWCDPESAQAVYDSGVPVTAVGLDVTRQVRADTNQLSNASEFVQRMCSHPGWSGYLHDPLTVGVAFDENLVRTESGSAIVDSSGRTRIKGTGSVQVAMEVDARRFVDLFLSRIASH
jgi:inosine-uridine nucleoside N-ribohydrolase